MALQNKCEVFLNNNEIIIAESSGFYSATNTTGWSHPSMNGGNPLTATVMDSNLTSNILSITLVIDGVTITISDGVNETILPVDFDYLSSPGDLYFTINPNTYASFYDDFGSFTDGTHDISYTITFTVASGYDPVTYTAEIFTYKEVEAEMWAIFHEIAYDHKNIRTNDAYIRQALYARAMFSALEYAARTTTNLTKAEEILEVLTDILDFNNVQSH